MNYTREQKVRGGQTKQRLNRQHEARVIELMVKENTVTIHTAPLIARYMKESIKALKDASLAIDLTDDELTIIAESAEEDHWNTRLPREERQAAGERSSAAWRAVQVRALKTKLDELNNRS